MTIRHFTFLAAICSAAAANAQNSVTSKAEQPAPSEAAQIEQTHNDIRALRDGLVTAVNEKDIDAILRLLHEDVILTAQDGDHLATVRKHDGVRDYLDRLLTGPNAGVRQMTVSPVVDELTILHEDDAGVAYGHSVDAYVLKDNSEFTLKTRWSATVVKTADGWRVASLHVSSNLFDNPVIDAMSTFAMTASCAAGLMGVALGFVAARFLKRSGTTAPTTANA